MTCETLREKIIEIIDSNASPLAVQPTSVQPSPPWKGEIKAILFDIYGTLLISSVGGIETAAARERDRGGRQRQKRIEGLLRRYKIDKKSQEIQDGFWREIQRRHEQARADGVDFPEVCYEEVWSSVLGTGNMAKVKTFAMEYEMIVNPVYPMPHLEEALAALREKGLVMGIISNAQFFVPYLFAGLLNKTLDQLGFDPALLFYSSRCGYAKPSAYMFHRAVEILAAKKLRPSNVLYIGNDMLKDILPAREVGFRTILFAGDSRSLRMRRGDPRCGQIEPDGVVTDITQLLGYI
jgi:putative hydrolase of the HAD superfamily